MASGEPPTTSSRRTDVEELKGVFQALLEFVNGLKQPIKEFIEMLTGTLDGSKVGGDVAEFYRRLREGGVPEDLAKEMTREYLRKRLEALPSLGNLAQLLGSWISKGKPAIMLASGDTKEALKALEAVKEKLSQEDREKIEKAIVVLRGITAKEQERGEEEKQEH